jgi:XTP/dITP diphosphohydrolase
VNRLLVATRNRGKQREFAELLVHAEFELVFPDQLGVAPSDDEGRLESHHSFRENAAAKAAWFASRSGCLTVADDSGLEVDALGGAPGVRSRRFAGLQGADEVVAAANNAELLRQLIEVPDPQRRARFRCVLAVVDPLLPSPAVCFDGVTEGRILRHAVGRHGFGYDSVFFSNELGVSFGEASSTDKHDVSHRGRAVAHWLAARRAAAV